MRKFGERIIGIVKFKNDQHLGAWEGASMSTVWAWPTPERLLINFTSYPSTENPFQMYIEPNRERLFLHENIFLKSLEWSANNKDEFILAASDEALHIAKYHRNKQPLEILGMITSSSTLKFNSKSVKDDWAPLSLTINLESGPVQVGAPVPESGRVQGGAHIPVTIKQLSLPHVLQYSALPTGMYRLLHGGHEYIIDWISSDSQGSGSISSPSFLSASKILYKSTSNGHVANVKAHHGEFNVGIDVVRPGATYFESEKSKFVIAIIVGYGLLLISIGICIILFARRSRET